MIYKNFLKKNYPEHKKNFFLFFRNAKTLFRFNKERLKFMILGIFSTKPSIKESLFIFLNTASALFTKIRR